MRFDRDRRLLWACALVLIFAALAGLWVTSRAGTISSSPEAAAATAVSLPEGPDDGAVETRSQSFRSRSSRAPKAWKAWAERVLSRAESEGGKSRLEKVLASWSSTPHRDPLDLGMALRQVLLRDPDLLPDVLEFFRSEEDPAVLFQVGRAMAVALREKEAVTRFLESWEGLDLLHQEHALFSLVGSTDPDVAAWLGRKFSGAEQPGVQAKAAFVLSDVVEELPESEAAPYRLLGLSVAQHSPDPAVRGSCMHLAAAADAAYAKKVAVSDPVLSVRIAALEGLATAGETPAELLPLVKALSRHPDLSESQRVLLESITESQ